jgi:DNA-binding transcriptional regulator LsrR (DeoR family)
VEQPAAVRRVPGASRLDQAARAAWLYYVGGRTQDEIALRLGVSRQAAQRLVSLAVAEKLIKFRLDHPVAACMALEASLIAAFGLRHCEVVPSDPEAPDALPALATAGAAFLERWLQQRAPGVLALSTGRTLRAVVDQVSPLDAPRHKVMSLCGTMRVDGRAGSAEPVIRLAERTGAQCYPMPAPVVAATVAERELFQAQRPFATLSALLAQASCALVGVGEIAWQAPLHASGFIDDQDLGLLMQAGAVGEIAGWSFDAAGRMVDCPVNARVNGLPPPRSPATLTVGVGAGPRKAAAMRAAVAGGLVQGLLTDEATARLILEPPAALRNGA